MNIFIVVSGDYIYGAAALCNSLYRAGITGEIHIGHSGALNWEIDCNAPIVTHELRKSPLWIGNCKPNFLMDHACGNFVYLDADCMVTNGAFLEYVCEAIKVGPVFCAEGVVPERDIRRLFWARVKATSADAGRALPRRDRQCATVTYFNSGFFAGDIRRDRWILEGWERLMQAALRGEGKLFENRYFPMPDQDCLNAFIQDEPFLFSCIAPPDVWYAASSGNPFLQVGIYESSLLHCTGEKPWQLRRVPPRPPNIYELMWFHHICRDTPWIRCSPEMDRSVESWLRRGILGRAVSRLHRIQRRLSAR